MEYVWMQHPSVGTPAEVPATSVAYYESKGWYTVEGPANRATPEVPVFLSPDDPAEVLTVPGVQFQPSAGGLSIHTRDGNGNNADLDVTGEADRAVQARDDAVQAKAEAEAFGGTNNTQVAGMVTGPGPTRDALISSIVRVAEPPLNPFRDTAYDGSNGSALLAAALTAASQSTTGRGEVYLPYTAAGYDLTLPAVIPAGVTLTGDPGRRTPVRLAASRSRLFDLTNAGVSLANLDLDINGLATSALIRMGARRQSLRNVRVRNLGGALNAGVLAAQVAGAATDYLIDADCEFEGLLDNIQVYEGATDGLIESTFTNWGNRCVHVLATANGASNDLRLGDRFRAGPPSTTFGDPRQPIAIQRAVDATAYHLGLRVGAVRLEGNGLAHHTGSDGGALLGGTADMLSLHGCRDFIIEGPRLTNGGEVGITIARDSREGLIQGATVEGCNTTALAIEGCYDIKVNGLVARDNGKELAGSRTGVKNAIWVKDSVDIGFDNITAVDNQGTPTQLSVFYLSGNNKVRIGETSYRGGTTRLLDPASSGNSDVRIRPLPNRVTTAVTPGGDFTVTNTTTPAPDPILTRPVEALGVYRVRGWVITNSSTVADAKIGWTLPAGSTMSWVADGPASTAASGNTPVGRTALVGGSAGVIGGAAADTVTMLEGTLTVGATAGDVVMTFAQNTAEATNTIRRGGSWLELERIG